jgi:hypothetical protein
MAASTTARGRPFQPSDDGSHPHTLIRAGRMAEASPAAWPNGRSQSGRPTDSIPATEKSRSAPRR